MVFLDSRHANIAMDIIKKDLSPLIKDLEPGNPEEEAPIPYVSQCFIIGFSSPSLTKVGICNV